jgi:hypothetical protein
MTSIHFFEHPLTLEPIVTHETESLSLLLCENDHAATMHADVAKRSREML